MDVWNSYSQRVNVRGNTKRDSVLNREVRMLNNKLPDSLSFHTVEIDGVRRNVSVINSDNLNEKHIISMPNEDIREGGLVFWMDNYWLITERDANTTVYTKCKMIQCNFLLKWISDDCEIHEQWCIIEDGTKYLNGILEDRNFVITRGDSRIAMTIAKNNLTKSFNRDTRFIIDDPDSDKKLSYILSKPLKVGHIYNNHGVYKFVLQEVQTTVDDNLELGIADYYKHIPREPDVTNTSSTDMPAENSGKKVWL